MKRWPAAAAWILCLLCLAGAVAAQDAGIRQLAVELTGARETAIRKRAAQALGRTSTPLSVRMLAAARSTETSAEVRLEIVRALRTIAFQRYPGYRDALRAIGQAADDATEADELVRLRATEALWEAGDKDLLDPVPLMERQLADRSQRVRMSAVLMLRKTGTPEAAHALGRAILDPGLSETIRLAAIDALGAVALSAPGVVGRQVVAANIAITDRFGAPAVPSRRALELRHEDQIRYLTALVRAPDSSPTLVLRAVKSMGRIKDHTSIPVLRQLIATHPSIAVRRQATIVLSHVMARQYE